MINDFFQMLVDLLLWLPRKIYEFMADAIEDMLDWLPSTPLDLQSAMNSWPSDVLYFMGLFEVDYAITALFTAAVARFFLRRIPAIG